MTATATTFTHEHPLHIWVYRYCNRMKGRCFRALHEAGWSTTDMANLHKRFNGNVAVIADHLAAMVPGVGDMTAMHIATGILRSHEAVANGDKEASSPDNSATAGVTMLNQLMNDVPDATATIQQRLWWIREQRDYIQKVDLSAGDAAYDSAVAHPELVRAVRPLFQKARVLWYPLNCKRHECQVVDTSHGPALWAEYTWTFRFQCVDDAADFIDVEVASTGWSWKFDGYDKGPGKASTYADKYALMRVLGLEAGDDPDFTSRTGLETEVDEAVGQKIIAIRHLLDEQHTDNGAAVAAEAQTLAALARKHSRPSIKNIFGLPEDILDEWLEALRSRQTS